MKNSVKLESLLSPTTTNSRLMLKKKSTYFLISYKKDCYLALTLYLPIYALPDGIQRNEKGIISKQDTENQLACYIFIEI